MAIHSKQIWKRNRNFNSLSCEKEKRLANIPIPWQKTRCLRPPLIIVRESIKEFCLQKQIRIQYFHCSQEKHLPCSANMISIIFPIHIWKAQAWVNNLLLGSGNTHITVPSCNCIYFLQSQSIVWILRLLMPKIRAHFHNKPEVKRQSRCIYFWLEYSLFNCRQKDRPALTKHPLTALPFNAEPQQVEATEPEVQSYFLEEYFGLKIPFRTGITWRNTGWYSN